MSHVIAEIPFHVMKGVPLLLASSSSSIVKLCKLGTRQLTNVTTRYTATKWYACCSKHYNPVDLFIY